MTFHSEDQRVVDWFVEAFKKAHADHIILYSETMKKIDQETSARYATYVCQAFSKTQGNLFIAFCDSDWQYWTREMVMAFALYANEVG